MLLRDMPVRDLMVTEVLTFTEGQNVQDAMRALVEWDVDAAPVVDEQGHVRGILSTGDLIVEEARLHFPTIVNFLGVNVALPWHDKELDESVSKALGEFVGEAMTSEVVTVSATDTVEDAATLMHDHQVSRLPVTDDDGLIVGLIARGDIIRAMVRGLDEPDLTPYDESEDEFTEMLEARAGIDDSTSDATDVATDVRPPAE